MFKLTVVTSCAIRHVFISSPKLLSDTTTTIAPFDDCLIGIHFGLLRILRLSRSNIRSTSRLLLGGGVSPDAVI